MTRAPSPGDTDENRGPDSGAAPITVDDLALSFGELSVLEGVSVAVDPGEFVGLVGPNGAGKTTLLRAISGALEPDTGSVTVDGVDLHAVSSRESSRLVSVVPQDTTLSFSFPVRDVVEMGRHPHRSRFSPPTREDREAVDRALERTRTADLADRPIDEISGGQRQRVVLARAIAQETPALLLDEPTASLDINHAIETLELVRELVDDGRTAVAAIHDLDLAARYCDRLVMLADGGVESVGSPSAVLTGEALEDAFDATATVVPNPVTGTESVTALPDSAGRLDAPPTTSVDDSPGSRRVEGDGGQLSTAVSVHVVGTGTTATGTLARLAAADLSVSVGPVTPGVVTETADRLEAEIISVEPHAPLADAQRRELEDRVAEADVTVLADPVIGAGNDCVLEVLAAASPLVVTDRRPLEDRVFDDTTRAGYEQICERAHEVSPETVLEGVRLALSEPEREEATSDSSGGSASDSSGNGTSPLESSTD